MLWVKSLHIVFVVSWFAGIFYLPRILVNLAMETDATSTQRLLLMARKLYRFMAFPAVAALVFGLAVAGIWLRPRAGQCMAACETDAGAAVDRLPLRLRQSVEKI